MSKGEVDGNCTRTEFNAALRWLAIGAILAAIGVALGAFGAHGLRNAVQDTVTDVEKSLEWWGTANRYLMYHSFAIIAVAITSLSVGMRRSFSICNSLFVAGIVLFSGCLFVMALTEIKKLGAIVPLGGLSLIAAWLTFSFGLFSLMRDSKK